MRGNYRYLIFDADDTLFDFHADVVRAFRAALCKIGQDEQDVLRTCIEFDNSNWDKIGLSDVHLPHVQESFHDLYRAHVRDIFAHAGKIYGFAARASEAEEEFNQAFAAPAHLIEGAEETLSALCQTYRICVATNGLAGMQYGRLRPLQPYLFRVFVSEEVGNIKPSGEYFRHILKELGATPAECLMIGDSVSSDMAGANAAKMDCVWFNRGKSAAPAGAKFTAQITSLCQLVSLLRGKKG